MLADLNTKSYPFARLSLLRRLWGIEDPDEEVAQEIKRISIRAIRYQTGGSNMRGSRDLAPIEEQEERDWTPEDTERKLHMKIQEIEEKEYALQRKYLEITSTSVGMLQQDHDDFRSKWSN